MAVAAVRERGEGNEDSPEGGESGGCRSPGRKLAPTVEREPDGVYRPLDPNARSANVAAGGLDANDHGLAAQAATSEIVRGMPRRRQGGDGVELVGPGPGVLVRRGDDTIHRDGERLVMREGTVENVPSVGDLESKLVELKPDQFGSDANGQLDPLVRSVVHLSPGGEVALASGVVNPAVGAVFDDASHRGRRTVLPEPRVVLVHPVEREGRGRGPGGARGTDSRGGGQGG